MCREQYGEYAVILGWKGLIGQLLSWKHLLLTLLSPFYLLSGSKSSKASWKPLQWWHWHWTNSTAK